MSDYKCSNYTRRSVNRFSLTIALSHLKIGQCKLTRFRISLKKFAEKFGLLRDSDNTILSSQTKVIFFFIGLNDPLNS